MRRVTPFSLHRPARGFIALLAAVALLALVAVTAAVPPPAAAATGPRSSVNLNREWKFLRGDWPGFAKDGPEATAYDDAAWSNVGLPHSFSTPYNLETTFFTGYGWYRRHLDAPAAWSGKTVRLEFEGAFQVAEVWVNGESVGTHTGGYTGFSFDIGNTINTGDNVIAVRVNNLWNGAVAPRAGEHVFSGGIYRDVSLTVTDPVGVAWSGTGLSTSVQTPIRQVDEPVLKVDASTDVTNASADAAEVTVRTTVTDTEGDVVGRMSTDTTIAAGATKTITQHSEPITDPHLWSPSDPYLHDVTTEVLRGGEVVDRLEDRLGFRWTEWTKDQGFFLNGRHTELDGANVHQDQAGWGDAVTDAAIRRDVAMIKDAGLNFIRGSHYPHDPAFTRAADELGVMVLSEAPFWGIGGTSGDNGSQADWLTASAYPVKASDQAGFEASVKHQLEAMIKIHRNRASVIGWSLSNEPFFSSESVRNKVVALLTNEVEWAHAADPTRGAGIGGGQRWDLQNAVPGQDFIGFNGDGGGFYLDRVNGKLQVQKDGDGKVITPPVASIVTEYGSRTDVERPGVYRPFYDYVQADTADPNTKFVPEWRAGQALWAGFDHGSVAGIALASMGMIDYHRLPKRTWYWYRHTFNPGAPAYLGIADPGAGKTPAWPAEGTPTGLELGFGEGSSNTIVNDGTSDTQLVVKAIKDGKQVAAKVPVTLTIKSGPGQLPTSAAKAMDAGTGLPVLDGIGATTFRSYYPGTTVIEATAPGLAPATITVTTTASPTAADSGASEPSMKIPSSSDVIVLPEPETIGANMAVTRPVAASSAAAGRAAGLANDGDPATSWQAGAGGAGQYWQISPEGAQFVYQLNIRFAVPGVYGYKVQGGDENGTFVDLLDRSSNTARLSEVTERLAGQPYRSFRIVFNATPEGTPANLAEVGVLATQKQQYALTGDFASDKEWTSAVSGWATVQKDKSIDGKPLTINGVVYPKGIGTHSALGTSDAVVTYALDGRYSRLVTDVGVDDEVAPSCGSNKLAFDVFGDGALIATSGTMSASDAAKTLDVSVFGVRELRLVVRDTDKNNGCDHADWGNPRLLGVLTDGTVGGSPVTGILSRIGVPNAGAWVAADARATATAASSDPVALVVGVYAGDRLVTAQKLDSPPLGENESRRLLHRFQIPADAGTDLRTEIVLAAAGETKSALATTTTTAETTAMMIKVFGSLVPAGETATTVVLTPTTQVYGTAKPATAKATVTAASGTPAGTVAFSVGESAPFATVVLGAGGTASATLPAGVRGGTRTIVAKFVPADGAALKGSTASAAFTVSQARSTTNQAITTKKLGGVWTARVRATVRSGSTLPACGRIEIRDPSGLLATIGLSCDKVAETQSIQLLVDDPTTRFTTSYVPAEPSSVLPSSVTTQVN